LYLSSAVLFASWFHNHNVGTSMPSGEGGNHPISIAALSQQLPERLIEQVTP
jgi:hypothetical protein